MCDITVNNHSENDSQFNVICRTAKTLSVMDKTLAYNSAHAPLAKVSHVSRPVVHPSKSSPSPPKSISHRHNTHNNNNYYHVIIIVQ